MKRCGESSLITMEDINVFVQINSILSLHIKMALFTKFKEGKNQQ
jgi:hypothetical protein